MHFEAPLYYEAADEAGLLLESAFGISHSYTGCDTNKSEARAQLRDAITQVRGLLATLSLTNQHG